MMAKAIGHALVKMAKADELAKQLQHKWEHIKDIAKIF